ncbi:MAG: hypothetical protein JKP97_19220 [Rhodobacteraceae bacterium]|jgi:hypothetical protein|nr:hypothetical protein [Paracoccaceae bacterium]
MEIDSAIVCKGDAMAVWQRGPSGAWSMLGRVGIDEPGRDSILTALCAAVIEAARGRPRTKLVLPAEDVMEIAGDGPPDAALAAALAARELPADAALVWDRAEDGSGGVAVAQETLDTAFRFFRAKGIEPVAITAPAAALLGREAVLVGPRAAAEAGPKPAPRPAPPASQKSAAAAPAAAARSAPPAAAPGTARKPNAAAAAPANRPAPAAAAPATPARPSPVADQPALAAVPPPPPDIVDLPQFAPKRRPAIPIARLGAVLAAGLVVATAGVWLLVGGTPDPGDTPAMREVAEAAPEPAGAPFAPPMPAPAAPRAADRPEIAAAVPPAPDPAARLPRRAEASPTAAAAVTPPSGLAGAPEPEAGAPGAGRAMAAEPVFMPRKIVSDIPADAVRPPGRPGALASVGAVAPSPRVLDVYRAPGDPDAPPEIATRLDPGAVGDLPILSLRPPAIPQAARPEPPEAGPTEWQRDGLAFSAAARPPARPGDLAPEAAPPAPENPGALALAPRPPDRPDALARQIERRRAAAAEMRPETPPAAQPAAEPAAPAPAAAAPAVAAPQVPQTASVAAAATETNELSMRRLTLIGVLGTPSNRTALIRSPNGRITRVSVNDQIGRGRIVAIGPDSLSYVENGRTRTLEMP